MAEISNSNNDVKTKSSRPLIEFAPLFLFFGLIILRVFSGEHLFLSLLPLFRLA